MITTAVLVNYLPFVFSSINGNFYMYYSCAIQKNVVPLQRKVAWKSVMIARKVAWKSVRIAQKVAWKSVGV